MDGSRRKFLSTAAVTTASLALSEGAFAKSQNGNQFAVQQSQTKELAKPKQPVIITKVTGKQSIDQAWQMLKSGQDTLDAVLHILYELTGKPWPSSWEPGPVGFDEGRAEFKTRMLCLLAAAGLQRERAVGFDLYDALNQRAGALGAEPAVEHQNAHEACRVDLEVGREQRLAIRVFRRRQAIAVK